MDKIVTKTALEQLAEVIAEKLKELEDRIAALEGA